MSVDTLTFQEFVGTTADEQRWQICNAVLEGGGLTNTDVAVEPDGVTRAPLNLDSSGRLIVDIGSSVQIDQVLVDLTSVESKQDTSNALLTTIQSDLAGTLSSFVTLNGVAAGVTVPVSFASGAVSISGGTVTLGAGTNSIGSIDNTSKQFSKIAISTQSITRPANTTAYSANAVINTATSGATATQFSNVLPVSGGDGYIVAVRAATNVSAFSTALRLHLFKTTPNASVQDAAQFTMLNADFTGRVGYVDLSGWTTGGTGSDTAVCFGSFPGAGITLPLELGTTVLYAILETRAAFTPTSGQIFSISLKTQLA